ncbi:rhomboid family intramembrane serine protease [Halobacteriales archaeon Cl-PHB]
MARRRSPTLETLTLVLLVTGVAWVASLLSLGLGPFGLAVPLDRHPWTLVTSVYTHWTLGHLLANAFGLVLLGLLVERRTSRTRFHTFVLGTGMLAGVSQVLASQALGSPVRVLGISGAVFALLGYLLAGNAVTQRVLDRVRLSARLQVLVGLVVAVGVTLATAGPGMALVGHAVGLVFGLAAGRARLLDR